MAMSRWWAVFFAISSLVPPASVGAAELGPRLAKGLVIFSVGDDAPAEPPPILGVLRDGGWDLVVNRVPPDLSRERELGLALFDRSRQAEAEGYGKVILAGESFGAWVSLLANSSWTTPTDGGHLHAVVAIDASATTLDASSGTRWHDHKFMNVLKSQDDTRLAVFLYDATAEEGAQRQEEVLRAPRTRLARLVVVGAAPMHGPEGPQTEAFAHRWGACLLALFETADPLPPSACRAP